MTSSRVSSTTTIPNCNAPVALNPATKRKLDDAIHSLDNAVGSSESLDQLPPAKKPHISRSLYSTLAKYGIKTKDPKSSLSSQKSPLSTNTPHLTAILARAATRTRKAIPFKNPGHVPSSANNSTGSADYRPSSISSFLSRLATFKLSTFANKPPPIDAVAASKCGWINVGKDRLVCGICDVSWVVAGRDGMTRDAATALIEKQRVSLIEMHKSGCPWKTRQCDASIYRIPLQAPAVMAKEIKKTAVALEVVLAGVDVKHPLTSSQLQSLRSAMYYTTLPSSSISETPELVQMPTTISPIHQSEPSETAILTSLFGWSLAPPPPVRPRPTSVSRPSSMLPTSQTPVSSMLSPAPHTPVRSRSPSVMSVDVEAHASTPTPSTPRSRSLRLGSVLRSSPTPSERGNKRDTSLLHCTLCQRRVGLWAFAPPQQNGAGNSPARPQRQFDLLREHRSHCPYVVRSTVVPSIPPPNSHIRNSSSISLTNGQPGALEGWRAVLTVVVRYGIGQRHRMGSGKTDVNGIGHEPVGEDSVEMDVDGVEVMMEGVKSRGGKDLLQYVKGLLG